RISKISGLNETGISTIAFDNVSKKLYIAYNNSNIDVLGEKGLHNIPELKRENISGDKSINQIYTDNNRSYLSTGLGIIVLDADKFEISESWFIGNTGGYVKTYAFTKNNEWFYAATDEGLKKIYVNHPNPADYHNWQNVSGTNGLSSAPAKQVDRLNGKTIVLQNDSLFIETGTNWNFFFANGWPITSIKSSENKLMISQSQSNSGAQVVVLNESGSVQRIIQHPNTILSPAKAISVNNEIWIADAMVGLSHWIGSNFETYQLNSPATIAMGTSLWGNNIFYASAGSVNDSWNYQFNRGGIFKLENGSWTNYNRSTYPQLDSLLDFITIAIDPRDGSAWAGSFGGGLLHLKTNNQLEIYKQNSPIKATTGDPGSYRIAGLAFDHENNLWMTNFGTDRQLLVLRNEGTWQSFTAPFFINFNAAAQIVIDDAGQKWIQSPLGNGLIVFNDNNTIDNPNDDKWKLYKTGTGNGNLPSNEVLGITKDKNGFIWIGTGNGVAVIQCPHEVFTTGCEAILPVIRKGNFGNFLFRGQEVRSIAVDGTNRKWIATSTGASLVSGEGDKIISEFSEENSPLLGNDVKSISVNGETGEVFFATSNGIVSFRGTATEATATKTDVLIFPNPVPPAYNGTIGIKGLTENTIVKITETNGRLVFQTRALGGQAIWNGKDYQGRQVSSGIYLVIADGKMVGKIVFISK
ncbi:MAG: type IX secretion system anionic LPS delivery protein PorZ, partial [Flavisolibacter sp.]